MPSCVSLVLHTCQVCGYRLCQRGYITLLICHVNIHDHVVRKLCDSIGGFHSPQVNVPCLVVIRIAEEETLSFHLSGDPTWSRGQRDMCHYGFSSPHHKLFPCQVLWLLTFGILLNIYNSLNTLNKIWEPFGSMNTKTGENFVSQ